MDGDVEDARDDAKDDGISEASPPVESPVAFGTFAAALRPVPSRDDRGRINGIARAGHPDEIWLKYLKSRHGQEKHTPAEWTALIDTYRKQAA